MIETTSTQNFIIVKRSLNPAFSDKEAFEGVMTEVVARQRAAELNLLLPSNSEFTYTVCIF